MITRHHLACLLLITGMGFLSLLAAARAEDPAPAPAEAAPAAEAAPPAEAAPAAEAAPPAETPPGPPPLADVRQVQVKVWISETNEKGLRDLGANMTFNRFVRGVEQTGSVQSVNLSTMNPWERFSTVSMPHPSTELFGAPMRPDQNSVATDGIQAYQGAGLEFSIIDTGNGTIDGLFQTLEQNMELDLISKPELMVANTLPAIIKAGGQVPFQDVSYSGTTPTLKVAWRDIGVNLNLTPTIMPNNYVKLDITQLEVSDTSRIDNIRGVDLPVFSSRSQTGTVFVPDGTTLVVGGLSSRVVRQSERRIPILGKLPLIGIPFRSRKSDAEVTSLLIFVSPTVVDMRAPTPQAKSALSFWRERGSEWANKDRIEREVDAMQSGY